MVDLKNIEFHKNPKDNWKEEIICPKCDGKGGKDIAVPTSPQNVMWISDGECMELGWEDCKKCNGTGKIIIGDKK